jgi:hypothetical protein
MSNRKSFVGCPLLITHWDPDLYPRQPLPLVAELVIHILAHGEVWLKEVDLFLNSKIATCLSDPVTFRQFSSLVATKRVRILIPDRSRNLEDPIKHPVLSTAMEIVRSHRPLKSRPWRMTERHRRLCEALDRVLVANGGLSPRGVVRQRIKPPPNRNAFAGKLIEVLNGPDKRWRQRPQFEGLDDRIAERFTKLAANHESALDVLRKKDITPNATNGFYRSLLYQCADCLLPTRRRRAMKNLGQSVYAYCELDREKAAGTYHGSRVAELPPTDASPDEMLLRVDMVPTRKAIRIPVAENIGDIISAVLEDCADSMRGFWAATGTSLTPEVDFSIAWEHVADAFAKHSVDAHRGELSSRGKALWHVGEYVVHGAEILSEAGKPLGVRWMPDVRDHPIAQTTLLFMNAIATFGRPAMEYIRRGRADAERGKIKRALLDAATARCGRVA